MIIFSRRLFGVTAVFALAVVLSACGDPEPEQRKAFIAFLQKMVDRQGVHVMNTLPADEKTFGDYTKHYAIIIDFNEHMRAISEKSADKMIQMGLNQTQQRTIEQMVSHRADIVAASQQVGEMRTAVSRELATAQASRAILKQPDDLKKVYDSAFDKLVIMPAQAVDKVEGVLLDGTKISLQLIDYIVAHPGKIVVNGSQLRATDAKIMAEMNDLLKAHNAAGTRLEAARRDMQRVVEGS
jgi:hypothetical protein